MGHVNLESAAKEGRNFLTELAGYSYNKLAEIRKEGVVWILRFDVSFMIDKERIVELWMDCRTGEVLNFKLVETLGE